jgi:hypothetical protein
MNESEKQFSFTRATPSTSERAQNQIPISSVNQFSLACATELKGRRVGKQF